MHQVRYSHLASSGSCSLTPYGFCCAGIGWFLQSPRSPTSNDEPESSGVEQTGRCAHQHARLDPSEKQKAISTGSKWWVGFVPSLPAASCFRVSTYFHPNGYEGRPGYLPHGVPVSSPRKGTCQASRAVVD